MATEVGQKSEIKRQKRAGVSTQAGARMVSTSAVYGVRIYIEPEFNSRETPES